MSRARGRRRTPWRQRTPGGEDDQGQPCVSVGREWSLPSEVGDPRRILAHRRLRKLAVILAEAIRTGPREAGRRAARAAVTAGADPVEFLRQTMARGGFDPIVLRRGRSVAIGLRRCPFPEAAAAEPEIVCAVHRGIAEGDAQLAGDRLVVEDLVRRHPSASPCRLLLHLTAAGDGEGSDG